MCPPLIQNSKRIYQSSESNLSFNIYICTHMYFFCIKKLGISFALPSIDKGDYSES